MEPFFQRNGVTIYNGDALTVLRQLPAESINCCVTSPPYWKLRDYDVDGQLGLEPTPEAFVKKVVEVFAEVRRVLRGDGTLWVNLGDSYAAQGGSKTDDNNYAAKETYKRQCARTVPAGLKEKDLVGIPWQVAFALRSNGWYLRSDIIWHKPNILPESVKDRPTKAHEYIFLLSKSARYFYDHEAIKEPASPDTHARYARGRSTTHKFADGGPGDQTIAKSFDHMRKPCVNPKAAANAKGSRQNASFSESVKDIVEDRNKRSVWSVPNHPFPGAHFATFPEKLIEPCILAGCPEGGIVLDCFLGSGTTAAVAQRFGRQCIGIELKLAYCKLSARRFRQRPLFPSEQTES